MYKSSVEKLFSIINIIYLKACLLLVIKILLAYLYVILKVSFTIVAQWSMYIFQ